MASSVAKSETPAPLRASLIPHHEARGLGPSWNALCANLLEENPFFAPDLLLPALEAYADDRVRLACVWDGDSLTGLWPVKTKGIYARLPIAHWTTWRHPHCYYGAPLVRQGFEEATFCAFFSLFCEGGEGRAFVRMGHIEQEGAVMSAALAATASDRRLVYDAGTVARAALSAGASAEATIAVHIRKKKRKELSRLRNRLEELGGVCVRELSSTDNLEDWTESFLTLEDKSWKGEQGTSLKSNPRDARWFRETLAGAHQKDALHFLRLDLDGRPIAMLTTLLSKGAGYSLKIAHDPEFARFSPGVMIEIEAMRSLLDRADFRFADSCAAPDHSMINGLWRARRTITGLNVSGRHVGARTALGAARLLERARARLPKG